MFEYLSLPAKEAGLHSVQPPEEEETGRFSGLHLPHGHWSCGGERRLSSPLRSSQRPQPPQTGGPAGGRGGDRSSNRLQTLRVADVFLSSCCRGIHICSDVMDGDVMNAAPCIPDESFNSACLISCFISKTLVGIWMTLCFGSGMTGHYQPSATFSWKTCLSFFKLDWKKNSDE